MATGVPPASDPATAPKMKCVHASALGGDIDQVLTIKTDAPRPSSDQVKSGKCMMVKVEACSLSRGDTLNLNGSVDLMLKPDLPFIPGMDICGVVEEIAESCDKFKVGDRVIATNGMTPTGGLAEYALVQVKYAGKAPDGVDATQAAVLPNSPVTALHAVQAARVKEGDRVLVLGGSGGVGSSLLQLVKDAKASYLATTSTAKDLCLSLGADDVIDYRETNWYESESYKNKPFDVVIDCVGWRDEWKLAGRTGALKSAWNGGRYISVASSDDPQIHTVWQIGVTGSARLVHAHSSTNNLFNTIVPLGFVAISARRLRGPHPVRVNLHASPTTANDTATVAHLLTKQMTKFIVPQLWRSGWTCVNRLRPRFKMVISDPSGQDLAEMAALVAAGRLKPVLDPASPFPFTEDGVRAAFKLQASKHAHGKVVVSVQA